MAEDLMEFIESLRISPINLIGHSMGGKTAMQFALTYPEAVDKLIVADISPRAYPPHHSLIIEALCSLDLKSIRSRGEADAALAVKIPDPAVRGFLMKNLMRDESNAFAWKANLDAIKKNFNEINRSIDSASAFVKPTLFIRGERSNYVLDEDEPLIKRIFPQSTIETVKGAGHWVHAEAPNEFFDIASGFLSV
jgi:pimeloyl-ACP methyl ester carboxylesterase